MGSGWMMDECVVDELWVDVWVVDGGWMYGWWVDV